jgi:hypothetical protein
VHQMFDVLEAACVASPPSTCPLLVELLPHVACSAATLTIC